MKALVVVEHNHQHISLATLPTITAAALIDPKPTACVIGSQCEAVAEQIAAFAPIQEVICVNASCYQDSLAENMALALQKISAGFTHLLAPATTFGKNLMPRVAALLNVPQLSDITGIVSPDTFVRPIYAGNAFATVQNKAPIQVITVRGTAFTPALKKDVSALIQVLILDIPPIQTRLVSREKTLVERPDLGTARIIVSGGRGLQSKENFKLLEQLADKLHAAIGASRAAVDAGFAPNDYQIGQTGRVVAPDLYIAIGISGAIQHVAGIKDSKIIVAINKDPDAPIFQVADYGLVGDLFQVLPQLLRAME